MGESDSQSPGYRRSRIGDGPTNNSPAYRSTALRHPKQPLVIVPQTLSEITGPVFGSETLGVLDHDLTVQHAAPPLGERIILEGRVLDEDGRSVPDALVEIWQANAAGRYAHASDTHDASLDARVVVEMSAWNEASSLHSWSR